MIFLLKDEHGHALVIAEAATKEEADRFGFRNFPTYCGRSVELDPESRREAELFWSVPSVRVAYQILDPRRKSAKVKTVDPVRETGQGMLRPRTAGAKSPEAAVAWAAMGFSGSLYSKN